jgi:SAM-dependent methyltransferase
MKRKYTHDTITHNTRAAEIIIPELKKILNPSNALDVGCGIGTWTKILQEHQIEAKGLDYFEVDRSLLVIDENDFIPIDLEQGFNLKKKFDLIICLEVLEHLKESSSDRIIDSLTKHSDTLLFSAAIPMQGGDNHVNEQPFSYWQEKFEQKGYYYYDLFREKYWQNESIEWWYRQNMFLISKKQLPFEKCTTPNTYIHPGLFNKKNNEIDRFYNGDFPVSVGFKFFIKTILNTFKK